MAAERVALLLSPSVLGGTVEVVGGGAKVVTEAEFVAVMFGLGGQCPWALWVGPLGSRFHGSTFFGGGGRSCLSW